MSELDEKDQIMNGDYYEETYTMREQGRGISTTVPKNIVRRMARKKDMPIEIFLLTHNVQARYDSFTSIDYGVKFVEKKKEDKLKRLSSKKNSIEEKIRKNEIDKEEGAERIERIRKELEKIRNMGG